MPDPVTGKTCSRCGDFRQITDFWKRRGHNGRAGGFRSWCKECCKTTQRELRTIPAERQRLQGNERRYREDPNVRARRSEWARKRAYGLTDGQFSACLVAQNGVCPLCNDRPAEHLDHDHRTNENRAVLCRKCNTLMGGVDDREWLARAISYRDNGGTDTGRRLLQRKTP